MKQFKSIAFLAMMVIGSVITFAQDIAHIDTQAVLEAMPAYKKAEADLETMGKGHQTKIATMEAEYKTFMESVQKQLAGKSPEESQKIITTNKYQEKDQELQQKFQAYRQAAQEEMVAKEKALFDPIEKRVNDAISAAATKKGIKYVLPAGVTIYKNGGYDLFNDVKKELGL
ncbi:OmpH family outer membrane protein [Faecalibacter rhinopitheci]|uniref:OmpH family outer membrane protein n=1 Tax=Faecalibacter rhinopitheci TaxID=2779678 RepID=A0A8J7KHY9_9FLAO|nr:OmpH family outer membrane protein [Faecalibacter rhinopitheci]MBF0596856.1 OmpH family outer membrane protein [Faecalibacter rhinopitheci]MBQ0148267.1 OmpH family outer membrane protein [Candidatus Onthonaster equi]